MSKQFNILVNNFLKKAKKFPKKVYFNRFSYSVQIFSHPTTSRNLMQEKKPPALQIKITPTERKS